MSEIDEILINDLLIVNTQSNGLWGQPFAVGAVQMTSGGRVLSTLQCRCNIDEVPDHSVTLFEVEEKLSHFPLVENQKELMKTFLKWLLKANPIGGIFVDGGFPMDVRFLDLIKLSEQWYRHAPFPLYDVSSIMMTAGSDPREDREEYAKELIGEKKGRAYDPAWKAEVSGLCAIRALRKLQTMHRKG